MTQDELIKQNKEKGYLFVYQDKNGDMLYKKENGMGGVTYWIDAGYEESFAVWDTTMNSHDLLNAILKDTQQY